MRSLSQCNRLYPTRKGFDLENREFWILWRSTTFRSKPFKRPSTTNLFLPRRIQWRFLWDWWSRSLWFESMWEWSDLHTNWKRGRWLWVYLHPWLCWTSLQSRYLNLISFLENQSTKVSIRANIFKIYNTVSYRFTFLMKSLSEAQMIQYWKSFPIKLLLYPLHGVNHRFKLTEMNPPDLK